MCFHCLIFFSVASGLTELAVAVIRKGKKSIISFEFRLQT